LLDTDNDGTSGALGYKGETGKVACVGCHVPQAAFMDNRSHHKQISLAAGWGEQRARSPFDVGQSPLLLWGGRSYTQFNQIFGPLEASFEFNSSRLYAAKQMSRKYRPDYEAIFGPMPPLDDAQRFPELAPDKAGCEDLTAGAPCHGTPGDHAEFDGMTADDQDAVTRVAVNMGKAIEAYERLLSCGPGRFDAWVHGQNDALSEQEQRGVALFVGKGGCIACHSGPFFTDQKFHNIGLRPASVGYGFVDANDHGASSGLTAMLTDPLRVTGKFS